MQNVIFKKISFKNFRSHYEFEYEFKPGTLTAFVGKNGAGKSSVLLAIMTALYNDPMNGDKITDLVNSKKGKNLEIFLDFNINEDVYQIQKYYKHKQKGSTILLYKNGKNISEKTVIDTHKKIENIIVPKQVFYNTVYFAQQVKDFFTSLTDTEQKKIFNAILGLEEYKLYYEECDKNLKTGEKLLSSLSLNISNIETKIENNKNHIENLLNQKKKFYEEKEIKLKNLKSEIEEKTSEKLDLESEITKLKNEIDEINIDEIDEKIIKLNSQLNQYNKQLDNLNIDSDFEKEKEKRTLLLKNELLKIKEDIKTEIDEKIKEYNEKLNKINLKIQELENQKDSVIKETEQEFKEKRYQIEKNIQKLQQYKTELINDKELVSLKDKLKDKKYELQKQKDKAENDLINLNTQKQNLENILKELKENLNKIKESLNKDVKICSFCGSEIKDDEHIKKEQEKIENKINKINKEIENINDKILSIKNTTYDDSLIKELENEISTKENNLEQEIKKVNEKVKQYDNDIISIDKEEENTKEQKSIDLKKEIENIKNEKQNLINEIENIKSQFENKFNIVKQDKTNILKQELIEFRNKLIEQCEKEKEEINNKINKILSNINIIHKEKNKYNDIKKQIENIQNKITSISSDINNLLINMQNIKDEEFDDNLIKNIENENKKLEEENSNIKEQIVKISKIINILDFWKIGFSKSGIPSMLIDSSIPFLNKIVKEELEKICPGKFTVSFSTVSQNKAGDLKEKFSVNVINNYTGVNRRNSLSGGEKRIIDVCSMRALRALSENMYQKRINITLLDEVLDSLDDDNASNFCYNLKKICENQNIILISHSVSRVAECDEILRF